MGQDSLLGNLFVSNLESLCKNMSEATQLLIGLQHNWSDASVGAQGKSLF